MPEFETLDIAELYPSERNYRHRPGITREICYLIALKLNEGSFNGPCLEICYTIAGDTPCHQEYVPLKELDKVVVYKRK